MVRSCTAVINQGKHLSREPSTEVPLLSHFSMHVATLRSFYKVLINTTDKSCENGNVICRKDEKRRSSEWVVAQILCSTESLLRLPKHWLCAGVYSTLFFYYYFSFPWHRGERYGYNGARCFRWFFLCFVTHREFKRTEILCQKLGCLMKIHISLMGTSNKGVERWISSVS